MAVLVTAEVPGQTKEGYDGMLDVLGDSIRNAKGFIGHYAGRSETGCWTCIEVWETATSGCLYRGEDEPPPRRSARGRRSSARTR